MRIHFAMISLIASTVVLTAAPALAVPSHQAECRRITRQLVRYVQVAEMADERGDGMWRQSTLNHIDHLKERRVRLCPEWQEPNWALIYAKAAAEMAVKAGKVALQVLTFGTYPGI
jgi:hypothetical protein